MSFPSLFVCSLWDSADLWWSSESCTHLGNGGSWILPLGHCADLHHSTGKKLAHGHLKRMQRISDTDAHSIFSTPTFLNFSCSTYYARDCAYPKLQASLHYMRSSADQFMHAHVFNNLEGLGS